MYTLPSCGSEVVRSYSHTGRSITMMLLNIALSLRDRVLTVYFFSLLFLPSFSSELKSLLHLVLLLTQLWSSSSDDGVKNFANCFTLEGPMCLRGSSLMSFNPVSESLLFLWRAEAFSACTCFVDPLSHGCLRGYGRSGMLAAGGTETGLGWFCSCMATCFKTVIRCCCSLRSCICLLVTACPCFSLIPASRLLKEHSISNSSGDVDHDELADVVVVSGLEAFDNG